MLVDPGQTCLSRHVLFQTFPRRVSLNSGGRASDRLAEDVRNVSTFECLRARRSVNRISTDVLEPGELSCGPAGYVKSDQFIWACLIWSTFLVTSWTAMTFVARLSEPQCRKFAGFAES